MATFVAIDKEKLETLRNAAEQNVERLMASCGETNWAGEPFKLHSHLENDLNLGTLLLPPLLEFRKAKFGKRRVGPTTK